MSSPALPFDSSTFRRTLGMFATGIAVVTTRAANGHLFGLTINSFNSVSLTPPLILWSLGVNSAAREAFENCEYYAINILSAEQESVSNLFSSKLADRFSQVSWEPGLGDAPVLAGCCAVFEVRNRSHQIEGDHLLFIGEVARCDRSEANPLLFFNGKYRQLK
jgi:flavin reductase (DIM6/NTAB) family NADH-FMN oxidoreductase RutF